MSERQRAFTGSPFEAQFGFARAVRQGNRIIVAGTGPVEEDGSTTHGGAEEQAVRCCTLILRAVEQLGGTAADVVRTSMFLANFDDQEAVGEVHARFFGGARPAATMVGVSWLCHKDWKGEIEAEAIVS